MDFFKFYILQNKEVLEVSMEAWLIWASDQNSISTPIGRTVVGEDEVMTDFLSTDLSLGRNPLPVVFETAIRRQDDSYDILKRYTSYSEAITGHEAIVNGLRARFH